MTDKEIPYRKPVGDWLQKLVEDKNAPKEITPEQIAQTYDAIRQTIGKYLKRHGLNGKVREHVNGNGKEVSSKFFKVKEIREHYKKRYLTKKKG